MHGLLSAACSIVTAYITQCCMGVELSAHVTASDVGCPVIIASFVDAPAASAAAIAYCARWATIAASCASIFYVAAILAAASVADCYRLIPIFASLSIRICSSCSVQGSVLCPVSCFVRGRDCFPLSGSRRFSKSMIFGVRGTTSLPLLPLELDVADADPPLSMLELRFSLTRSPDSLPCCLRGANLLC